MTKLQKRVLAYCIVAVPLMALGFAYLDWLKSPHSSTLIVGVIYSLIVFGHAVYFLGWQRATLFMGVCLVVGFLAEEMSVRTCVVGCYEYTGYLGPKIAAIPAIVPFSWFMMIYPCAIMANLIAEGVANGAKRSVPWAAAVSLLTALIMTAWDLTLDPFMVIEAKAWIWLDGGAYFDIPIANYVSWVITIFTAVFAFKLAEWRFVTQPPPQRSVLLAFIPISGFALIGLSGVGVAVPDDLRIVPIFSMGISIFVATVLIVQLAFRRTKNSAQSQLYSASTEKHIHHYPYVRQLNVVAFTSMMLVIVICVNANADTDIQMASVNALVWQIAVATSCMAMFFHACTTIGWRRAITFFLIATFVSSGFEYYGHAFGKIYGVYQYTKILQPQLFGVVPIIVPVTYFTIGYVSHIIANLLLHASEVSPKTSVVMHATGALLTALVMTAWDLILDPVMVNVVGAWEWPSGGSYFGIPFNNFAGWIACITVYSFLFRIVEARIPLETLTTPSRWVTLLPIGLYASLFVGGFFLGNPVETRFIAAFAMGIPAIAATIILYGPRYRGVSVIRTAVSTPVPFS